MPASMGPLTPSMGARTPNPKWRILYVGDDGTFVATLRKALSDREGGYHRTEGAYELAEGGYQILSCGDRESAIMFLKSDISYQLLLIDFEWRGREGLKLASLARLLKHRKLMPIVLVTATEFGRQLKSKARNAGVNECVTKTADIGAIIIEIANRRLLIDS